MVAALTTGQAISIGVPIGAALTYLFFSWMRLAARELQESRRRTNDRRFFDGDWPWRA